MSLATKKMVKRYEQKRQQKAGMSPVDIELDLFSRQREPSSSFLALCTVSSISYRYEKD